MSTACRLSAQPPSLSLADWPMKYHLAQSWQNLTELPQCFTTAALLWCSHKKEIEKGQSPWTFMRGVQKVPFELLFLFIELCAPHVQQKTHLKAAYWNLTVHPTVLSLLPTQPPPCTHLRPPGAAAHLQVIGKWPHASRAYKADRLLLVRGYFDELPP